MDFVTVVPHSQGNIVILVVVDRFSKACHLIPLPKLQLHKLLRLYCSMSLGCMVFPKILCQTVARSLHPGSGRPSASWLGLQPVYDLGFIPSLLDRWNKLTKRLRQPWDDWSHPTPRSGVNTWFGQNLRTILFAIPQRVCHLLSVNMGFNLLSFQSRNLRWESQLPNIWFNGAAGYGGRPGLHFLSLHSYNSNGPTVGADQHQLYVQSRKSGLQARTFLSKLSHTNWLPG